VIPAYRRQDVDLIARRSRAMGLALEESDLGRILPLSDAAYLVLLSLGGTRLAERGLAEALGDSRKVLRLTPGTLAAELTRLIEQGLLEDVDGNERKQYRVTELGDAVLFVEAGRRRRRYTLQAAGRISRRD
jgi:hypothetical protein